MKIIELNINFAEEDLVLTNQCVIFWPKQKTLILSDLHLGKAAYFRKNGIALPVQISEQDLYRLDFLIKYYGAEKVIIVGDLIHAGANKEVELFKELTNRFPHTNFILIKGNHDRFREDDLELMGISQVHQEFFYGSIHFIHQPRTAVQNTISGHIHPGVNIEFPTKSKMRFPCYVVTENEIILPAFSKFTGLDTFSIPENAVFYAFYDEGIFMVK